MIVLIRNLPHATTNQELQEFAAKALQISALLPFKSGSIIKVNTYAKQFSTAPFFMNYGVVFFDSRKTGLRAIKRLNGRKLKNKIVEVREYFVRSAKNDRRLPEHELPDEIRNKRKHERRGDAVEYNGAKRYTSIFDTTNVYEQGRRGSR